MSHGHDPETLAFYDREARSYAARQRGHSSPGLDEFLKRLEPGARILELGCGGGQDAKRMLAAGFDVMPTDGSAALAAEAALYIGRPVRVLRFEDLDACQTYDAVWASASLLHVPHSALADVLRRIWRALKPSGVFFASFKAGDGEGGARDSLGRYNNLVSHRSLTQAYGEAGGWNALSIRDHPGGGYDGVRRTWLACLAVKVGAESPTDGGPVKVA